MVFTMYFEWQRVRRWLVLVISSSPFLFSSLHSSFESCQSSRFFLNLWFLDALEDLEPKELDELTMFSWSRLSTWIGSGLFLVVAACCRLTDSDLTGIKVTVISGDKLEIRRWIWDWLHLAVVFGWFHISITSSVKGLGFTWTLLQPANNWRERLFNPKKLKINVKTICDVGRRKFTKYLWQWLACALFFALY